MDNLDQALDQYLEYGLDEELFYNQRKNKQMSETISKSVWVAKTNTFGDKTYTNVLLSDEKWYGLGGQFDCADGDGITLTFTKNDKGFLNADPNSVKIFKGQGTKQPDDKKKGGKAKGSGGGGKGGWNSGQPDHVQIAIMAQSAQKAAVDMIVACLNADKLKLPAKKADQYDALVAYTDALTDVYLAKTAGAMLKVKNGLAISDLISTVPVVTSPSFSEDTAAVQQAQGQSYGGFVETDVTQEPDDTFIITEDTDFVES